VQSATKYIDPQLAFLTNYTYAFGVDDLVPFGASQFVLDSFLTFEALTLTRSHEAGQDAFTRYSHLISQTNLPFIRSSGGTRVVESATNWTLGTYLLPCDLKSCCNKFLGFSVASQHEYNPVLSVILPEHVNIHRIPHPNKYTHYLCFK